MTIRFTLLAVLAAVLLSGCFMNWPLNMNWRFGPLPQAVADKLESDESLALSDVFDMLGACVSRRRIVARIRATNDHLPMSFASIAAALGRPTEGPCGWGFEDLSRIALAAGRARTPSLPSTVGSNQPQGAPALKPGDTFSDELDSGEYGPEMVVIPAGRFRMGCSSESCWSGEFPAHDVVIPQDFAVSKYEVTYDDWDRCMMGGGCGINQRQLSGWTEGEGDLPMTGNRWGDARDYAVWLSARTGQAYRLLSEAEWEYVARAGSDTAYSWGAEMEADRAHCDSCGSPWEHLHGTVPVGSFEPNAFGVYDMHGNVWEWVADCWNDSYDNAPADGSAWQRGDCRRHVLRSGSWYSSPEYVRSAHRRSWGDSFYLPDQGFRVGRTLLP